MNKGYTNIDNYYFYVTLNRKNGLDREALISLYKNFLKIFPKTPFLLPLDIPHFPL